MNNEEKIKELTERIEKLEKIEHKRMVKNRIKIIFGIIKYIVIIAFLYFGYNYINEKYIKPYKEKIDYVDNKVNNVESSIDSTIDGLKKYFNR